MNKNDKSILLIKLGESIRKYRKQKKLSIETAALLCEINPNYLGDLERGKRNPTILILNKICVGLEIQLKDLFNF